MKVKHRWFNLHRHEEPPAVEPPAVEPPVVEPPAPLGEGGKAALEAERRARRLAEASAKELADKVAAFEAANLSESERQQKRTAEAEKRAELAELRVARAEAVVAHNLTAEDTEFLTGSTAEEIATQAERLAARLKGTILPPALPGAPPPSPIKDSTPPPIPDFRTATREQRVEQAAALGIRLKSR